MILGHIVGKVTPTDFSFKLEKETKKFEYIQVYHQAYDYVLCQIVELERNSNETIAKCKTIGYLNKDGKVRQIRIPFEQGAEVLEAEDEFIKKIIRLDEEKQGAYIGKLDGKDIDVYLDLRKLLTKHCAVLAKSGAGKSYTVGVLIEEILEKKIPLLILDPHGEYSSMKRPNEDEDEEKLAKFNVKPKGYELREYGDPNINEGVIPLKLSKNITNAELVHLLPAKLSSTQQGVLYSALKNIPELNFNELLMELEQEESSTKWSIINVIEYLNNLNIFSDSPTPYNELVKIGGCSVINLKGMDPEIQEIIAYKICKDLFEMRKQNRVPPFFLVLEEAHNFCPERSFGETKSSKILRTIASEGRKFGLGFCVISQRPARVDKSVLSQCTTQLIMKVTNPNDLKAIASSVEGITSESESEIKSLPIGTSLVSGVVDIPLFVNIRPRRSFHGGEAVDMLDTDEANVVENLEEFENKEMVPLIKPRTSIKDIKLMSEEDIKIDIKLIPAALITCKDREGEFKVLIERKEGKVVIDKEDFVTKKLPDLKNLEKEEVTILKKAFANKEIQDKQAAPLIEKGYLTKDKELSDDYIFSRLRNYSNYDNIDYVTMPYDEKISPNISEDSIRKKISNVAKVLNYEECYIVKYKTQTLD